MNRTIKMILPIADILISPLIVIAAVLMKMVRRAGVQRMPICRQIFMKVGVFPIRNHYYEPLFDIRQLRVPLSQDRHLPGIDWNVPEQLALLKEFQFNDELKDVRSAKGNELAYYLDNGSFLSGDAEYLYNLIRLKKPTRIVEVGSGFSTLMAIKALRKNQQESADYHCEHVCIEPYEMPWLERSGVTVVRRRVEEVDKTLFAALGPDDLLFIDSSHVIRPQGDVLFEYLELIPTLRAGVIVHIHDIFSPKDYLKEWISEDVRFWNEQYLLEAFLSGNSNWRIIGALNYLHHHHAGSLKAVCPFLTPDREPGSFYIQKSM